MLFLAVYLLLVNIIGAIFVITDKKRAKKNQWRIKERNFFICCILGGCPATYAAMKIFHHKTLHKRFMWGIPVIFVIQIIALIFLYIKCLLHSFINI